MKISRLLPAIVAGLALAACSAEPLAPPAAHILQQVEEPPETADEVVDGTPADAESRCGLVGSSGGRCP
jgi:hypothetical protein